MAAQAMRDFARILVYGDYGVGKSELISWVGLRGELHGPRANAYDPRPTLPSSLTGSLKRHFFSS